ncbi:Peptidase_C39 like family protein [Lachnospiraceae bacterium]|nr:Peptidase_C39 like family protein [Lachnospiraceae bacterium]
MNKKTKYILIFAVLPVALVTVFFLSMYLDEKKRSSEEASTESSTTEMSREERINAMLLEEYQKSQSTREFVEETTEAPVLSKDDAEYDDMIDGTDSSDVSGGSEVYGEDELSAEDEALIASLEEEARKNSYSAIDYNGISIVTGMNQVALNGQYVLGLTDAELNAPHPLFLQYDPRWAAYPYGLGTMQSSACGPTSLSMVITGLTNISNASPPMVATYSMNHGHYVPNQGTAHTLFTSGAPDFGLYCSKVSVTETDMKAHLDNGEMLILAMHYGNFTHSAAGHFIVVYGYNQNGFMVNDPGSYERSTKYWPFSVFGNEADNIYGFGVAY